MNRRQFVKAGVIGGAALAAGGGWIAWRDHAIHGAGNARIAQAALQDRIDRIVGAIAPVVLAGSFPADAASHAIAIERVTTDVGRIVFSFTPPVQNELRELFGLLDIGIARRLLTGVSHEWQEAGADEIGAFLDRWRHSRIAMLQSGYHALHDLIFGAWYASDSTWDEIGYAGPPNIL